MSLELRLQVWQAALAANTQSARSDAHPWRDLKPDYAAALGIRSVDVHKIQTTSIASSVDGNMTEPFRFDLARVALGIRKSEFIEEAKKHRSGNLNANKWAEQVNHRLMNRSPNNQQRSLPETFAKTFAAIANGRLRAIGSEKTLNPELFLQAKLRTPASAYEFVAWLQTGQPMCSFGLGLFDQNKRLSLYPGEKNVDGADRRELDIKGLFSKLDDDNRPIISIYEERSRYAIQALADHLSYDQDETWQNVLGHQRLVHLPLDGWRPNPRGSDGELTRVQDAATDLPTLLGWMISFYDGIDLRKSNPIEGDTAINNAIRRLKSEVVNRPAVFIFSGYTKYVPSISNIEALVRDDPLTRLLHHLSLPNRAREGDFSKMLSRFIVLGQSKFDAFPAFSRPSLRLSRPVPPNDSGPDYFENFKARYRHGERMAALLRHEGADVHDDQLGLFDTLLSIRAEKQLQDDFTQLPSYDEALHKLATERLSATQAVILQCLLISLTGMRESTLYRIICQYTDSFLKKDCFEADQRTSAQQECNRIKSEMRQFFEAFEGIVSGHLYKLNKSDGFELDDDDWWGNPLLDFDKFGDLRNDRIFSIKSPRLKRDLLEKLIDLNDAQNINSRTLSLLYRMLSEEAFRQDGVLMRHFTRPVANSLRNHRKIMEGLTYGFCSLGAEQDDVERLNKRNLFAIPTKKIECYLHLVSEQYLMRLEGGENWNLSRKFNADAIKSELLNLALSPGWKDHQRDAADHPFIREEWSLNSLKRGVLERLTAVNVAISKVQEEATVSATIKLLVNLGRSYLHLGAYPLAEQIFELAEHNISSELKRGSSSSVSQTLPSRRQETEHDSHPDRARSDGFIKELERVGRAAKRLRTFATLQNLESLRNQNYQFGDLISEQLNDVGFGKDARGAIRDKLKEILSSCPIGLDSSQCDHVDSHWQQGFFELLATVNKYFDGDDAHKRIELARQLSIFGEYQWRISEEYRPVTHRPGARSSKSNAVRRAYLMRLMYAFVYFSIATRLTFEHLQQAGAETSFLSNTHRAIIQARVSIRLRELGSQVRTDIAEDKSFMEGEGNLRTFLLILPGEKFFRHALRETTELITREAIQHPRRRVFALVLEAIIQRSIFYNYSKAIELLEAADNLSHSMYENTEMRSLILQELMKTHRRYSSDPNVNTGKTVCRLSALAYAEELAGKLIALAENPHPVAFTSHYRSSGIDFKLRSARIQREESLKEIQRELRRAFAGNDEERKDTARLLFPVNSIMTSENLNLN